MTRRLAGAGALAAAAALAASCANDTPNPAPCPQMAVLSDAARLVEFDGPPDADNIAYTAEILFVSGTCRYYEDKPITARMEIEMAFGRGPKASEPRKEFRYFVAVTRRNSVVIEKEIYPVKVRFGGDRVRVDLKEQIDKIVIPRNNERVSGTNFEIIVGLDLTKEQLAFNRSGKSLKFPDL